ncbi:MAG: EFR1 family ferrodoxin [Clostridia bacterium]|nr:EFR1 family ferrodoxin [Clostridia bacterium]
MIIYFTGTRNSQFVADRLSRLTDSEVCDAAVYLRKGESAVFTKSEKYIFVMPTYAAAPPQVFLDFIRHSVFPDGISAYFVITCKSSMSAGPAFCSRLAEEKRFSYLGTAQIQMPQNYIAFFHMDEKSVNREKIQKAIPEIEKLADCIREGRPFPDSGGNSLEYGATKLVDDLYYKLMVKDKAFSTTDACIGCGLCSSVCPLGNITLVNGKPLWNHHCTHCMACINLCPKDAIEYGRNTIGKPRYKGPEKCLK